MLLPILFIVFLLIGILIILFSDKHKINSYELVRKGLASAEIKVNYTPNWLGRQFKEKDYSENFIWDGDEYVFGSQYVWFKKSTGEKIGRMEDLDDAMRKFSFNK